MAAPVRCRALPQGAARSSARPRQGYRAINHRRPKDVVEGDDLSNGGSRSIGSDCGRWPTGCSARSARPTTLPGSAVLLGPQAVAAQALLFADPSRIVHPALVNGAAGVVITFDGTPVSVVGFTVVNDRILAIDALADPERIASLDLGFLDDRSG